MRWLHTVYVGRWFMTSDTPFRERRDGVVVELYRLPHVEQGDQALLDLIGELACTEDDDEFDLVWDDIYDWADDHMVWIDTIRVGV